MTRRIDQYRLEDHTLERGCLHGMQVCARVSAQIRQETVRRTVTPEPASSRNSWYSWSSWYFRSMSRRARSFRLSEGLGMSPRPMRRRD